MEILHIMPGFHLAVAEDTARNLCIELENERRHRDVVPQKYFRLSLMKDTLLSYVKR
jgi:hypothetical protein